MSTAKKKVLDTAESLFHQNGYGAISMRDIASALDMKKASLYYHAPGGKEQLYVEVTERLLWRHHRGLEAAITSGFDFEDILLRVAQWFMSQPPLYLFKMMDGDLERLSPENTSYLKRRVYELMYTPLMRFFQDSIDKGKVRRIPADMLTGMFLTIIEGVAFAHRSNVLNGRSEDEILNDALTIMISGIKMPVAVNYTRQNGAVVSTSS